MKNHLIGVSRVVRGDYKCSKLVVILLQVLHFWRKVLRQEADFPAVFRQPKIYVVVLSPSLFHNSTALLYIFITHFLQVMIVNCR